MTEAGEERVRWGTIIPLIGGSAIGCQQATGTLPDFHLSYSPFTNNEKHIRNYWPSVPFHYIDKDQSLPVFEDVDFVNSVCPCAGLSMLNTASSGGKKRGADAEANRWMYESSIYVLSRVRPKVLWGENAPGLFTNIGEGVIEKLRNIGREFGYSFSVMKTNTEVHGIPQNRPRTFYFFWRSPTVPMMEYSKRERKDLVSYLEEIPAKASQQDLFLNKGKASEKFRPYQYVLERLGKTHEEFAEEFKKGTITGYLEKNELIDDCIDWLKKEYPRESVRSKTVGNRTHIQYLEHVKRKRELGLGYWDDSPRFMLEGCFATVMKKTMMWGVHPKEDRFLSGREYMHLMGLPHDFTIDDERSLNHIAQNVPTCTARDMALQVVKFIRGQLPMTDKCFIKQDNILGRITEAEKGEVMEVKMEDVCDPVRAQRLFDILIQPALVKEEEGNSDLEKKEKIVPSERKREKEMTKERKRLAEKEEKESIKAEKEEAKKRKRLVKKEELKLRKKEREMAKERKRLVEKEEKESIKAEKEEAKKMKFKSWKDRSKRRKSNSSLKSKTDNSSFVTWDTATPDQRMFACYICKVFPRPGSFNRSELYRHYSIRHFSKQIRETFISADSLSLPCLCPFCPEDSGKYLNVRNSVTHLGQVHLLVEGFLLPKYHVSGDSRRNVLKKQNKFDEARVDMYEVERRKKRIQKEESKRKNDEIDTVMVDMYEVERRKKRLLKEKLLCSPSSNDEPVAKRTRRALAETF